MCCAAMCCGRLSCVVVYCHVVWCHVVCCGVVGYCGIGFAVWLVEWWVGCLFALACCHALMFGSLAFFYGCLDGWAVWCPHPVEGVVACGSMLCDVMFVGTHVFAAIPRERGGW